MEKISSCIQVMTVLTWISSTQESPIDSFEKSVFVQSNEEGRINFVRGEGLSGPLQRYWSDDEPIVRSGCTEEGYNAKCYQRCFRQLDEQSCRSICKCVHAYRGGRLQRSRRAWKSVPEVCKVTRKEKCRDVWLHGTKKRLCQVVPVKICRKITL